MPYRPRQKKLDYYEKGEDGITSYARAVTKVVAASNSLDKTNADYICDGVNDEVEIQAAIDALGTTGGIVKLMEGTFNIHNKIILKSGVSLIGSGAKATILKAHSDLAIGNQFFIDNNQFDNAEQIDIQKISFWANNKNVSAIRIRPLSTTNSSFVRIKDCEFYEFVRASYEYIIRVDYIKHLIEGNIFRNCSQRIISGGMGIVSNNYFLQCSYLHIYAANGEIIQNNKFINTGSYEEIIRTSGTVIIRNNFFSTVSSGGDWNYIIRIIGASANRPTYAEIVNNYFYDVKYNCILLDGASYCKINNNLFGRIGYISNNTYDVILLRSSGVNHSIRNTISNNIIFSDVENKPRYGIRENDANQNYNLIQGNYITDCVTKSILILGDKTREYNNFTDDKYYAKLDDSNLTADRTFAFPDKDGTLALTSDLVTTFLDLIDTPNSYTGNALKYVRVNADENALEFVSGGVSVNWGDIGGTLSDQTDLQNALDAKANYTDLANYVPYTGATQDVDLGGYDLLNAFIIKAESLWSNFGDFEAIDLQNRNLTSNNGAASLNWATKIKIIDRDSGFSATLDAVLLTAHQIFIFPDKSGTFALTSDISWGNITGILSNQTDLQNALNNKVSLTGDEIIAGIKTFSSFPILPSSNPISDYQAVHKKYVDELATLAIEWQKAVKDKDLSQPPVNPAIGDRYIINYAVSDNIVEIQPPNTFIISGNRIPYYSPQDKILVRNSAGNNGWYTIQVVEFHPPNNTRITVQEDIPNPNPGGTIYNAITNTAFSQIGVYKIAEWNGNIWNGYTPQPTWIVAVNDENNVYKWQSDVYEWQLLFDLSNYDFVNGLILSGNQVKLGGSLIENTTIDLGDYNLNFNITGTGKIGIKKSSPNSYLDIGGSVAKKIDIVSADITLDETHHTIYASPSVFLNVYLPDLTSIPGREYEIKNIGSGSVVIYPYSGGGFNQYIDGRGSYVLSKTYDYVVIRSDGRSNWYIVSKSDFPLPLHASTHQSNGSDPLTGNLDANARVTIRKNSGSNIGTRRRLNFIEGSGVSINVEDDSANEEVDITISSTGGGGGGITDIDTLLAYTRVRPFYYTDFLGAAGAATVEACYPFDYVAINSGTQAKVASNQHHPGILRLASSTTANSGGRIQTDTTAFRIGGGEVFEIIFQHLVADGTNTTLRFGYLDTTSSSDATDGVYFEVPANSLNIVGKTANNSARSTTSTSYTLTINTWYRAKLVVNSNATRVDFYLYDDAGNLLWTDYLTTNIPTASGRETGAGVVATNSGTTATNLINIDWMAIWFKDRALIR